MLLPQQRHGIGKKLFNRAANLRGKQLEKLMIVV
jgi:hypothetical protein